MSKPVMPMQDPEYVRIQFVGTPVSVTSDVWTEHPFDTVVNSINGLPDLDNNGIKVNNPGVYLVSSAFTLYHGTSGLQPYSIQAQFLLDDISARTFTADLQIDDSGAPSIVQFSDVLTIEKYQLITAKLFYSNATPLTISPNGISGSHLQSSYVALAL